MTRDRRAVLRLLGAAGLAAVAAPVALVATRAAPLLAGRTPLAREMAPSRAAASGGVALVIVDSYNDFLSEEGLTWPLLKLVAEENDLVRNLLSLVAAARTGGARVAFAPHHRYRDGSFSGRRYLNPSQYLQVTSESFPAGRFGGRFYRGLAPAAGDIVASEHTSSSGFTETDLHDQLAASGVSHILLAGCISNTCIEATARSGVDLGYHVTVVTDAIAAFSPADHEFAARTTLPLIAHRTVSTARAVAELGGACSASTTCVSTEEVA